MIRSACHIAGIVALLSSLVNDCQAYLPVYGSPGYTPAVGGYIVTVGSIDFINDGFAVNDAGTAVASASRYNSSGLSLDRRAVRWNATTSTELGNLGTSGGLAFTSAVAINESGDAVGHATIGFSDEHAVRWNGSGTAATQLATPAGYAGARLQDVNASGTSLGMGLLSGGMGTHPVRWNALGTPTVLPRPSGYFSAEAYDINDAGKALGRAFTGSDDRAVRWDAAGTMSVLGHLGLDADGNTTLQPAALNSAGTAVGSVAKNDMVGNFLGTVPVRWEASGTAAVELDTLGPDPFSGLSFGEARAINDAGVAVGNVHKSPAFPTDEFGTRAAKWDPSGTAVTTLGHLGTAPNGEVYADAYAVNADGLIVGMATQYNAEGGFLDSRAVFWRASGVAIDLNSLTDPTSGWQLTHAYAVSNTGWIAGDGYFDPDGAGGQDPYGRHFLLQIPGSLSADFDHDGDVDGHDFLVWQRNTSVGNLADWEAHFGSGVGSIAASYAVPEPSPMLQIVAGLLLALLAKPNQSGSDRSYVLKPGGLSLTRPIRGKILRPLIASSGRGAICRSLAEGLGE